MDPDVLYKWEEGIGLAVDRHRLVTPVELVEITRHSNTQPIVAKQVLDPAQFRAWLDQADTEERAAPSSVNTLKLIIAGCDQPRPPDSLASSNTKAEGFPMPDAIQPWCCPFSDEEVELLRAKFHLSKKINMLLPTHSRFYAVSNFHVQESVNTCDLDGEGDRMTITLKFPGSDLVRTDASLALSHSPSTGTTRGLLLCRYWSQASWIGDTIAQHLADLSTHPAALPTVLCSLYQLSLLRNVDDTWEDVMRIEQASGQTGIALLHGAAPGDRVLPLGNADDPDLSRKAIRELQLATAWVNYVARSQALVHDVGGFMAKFMHQAGNERLKDQGRILEEYLALMGRRGEFLEHKSRHLLERARIQVEAINNYLAHTSNQHNLKLATYSHEIAQEAKRDSSSMKTIAVLTMTFLPATYIASLFATPGVSATNPSQALYWSISLPLTAAVLGIWAIWVPKPGSSIFDLLRAPFWWIGRRTGVVPARDALDGSSSQASTGNVFHFPAVPGEEMRNPELSQFRAADSPSRYASGDRALARSDAELGCPSLEGIRLGMYATRTRSRSSQERE